MNRAATSFSDDPFRGQRTPGHLFDEQPLGELPRTSLVLMRALAPLAEHRSLRNAIAATPSLASAVDYAP